VAASLAAARQGITVTLVEREEVLGGTAVLGLLGTICGLYRNGGEDAGEPLNGGILTEIVSRLCADEPPRKIGKVFVAHYEPGALQRLLTDLCARERNLTVCHGTTVTAVQADGGRVRQVVARVEGGERVFTPEVVIDASGDGELAALAGAEFHLSPVGRRQMAGIVVLLDGVAPDETLGIRTTLQIARGIERGLLPPLLRYTTFSRGKGTGEGALKISLPDGNRLTPGQIGCLATELLTYLALELPSFSGAAIRTTPGRSFHREGRRIRGEYRLTAADILSCRKFGDGVVRGAWPMELWEPGKGASYRYPRDNDYYDIPLRCLKARGFTNLFAAGRCISVSRDALGSTRVIGCCIPLGEQAGLAAARLCREE
jgi:hypothetical protein